MKIGGRTTLGMHERYVKGFKKYLREKGYKIEEIGEIKRRTEGGKKSNQYCAKKNNERVYNKDYFFL